MFNDTLLDVLPLWGVFLAACPLFWIAIEGGYRLGRWRHAYATDERDQPVGAMVGSILGLLALLLAFTFSLAAGRFDDRRQVVLEEANAIGTAYLRTELLPEPHRTDAARLLRQYVDVRVERIRERRIAEAISESEVLQRQLWATAVAAAMPDPHSEMNALFVDALNQVIDLHAKRVLVGVRSRIPPVIWIAIIGLAVLGMISIGYQAGLSATRRTPAMSGLVLAFAFVFYLIADLDRAGEGLFQVSQAAMADLQRSMASSATDGASGR